MDGNHNQQPPAQRGAPDRDPWSLQIARVAGIPIRLHFTFLLLIALFYFISGPAGALYLIALFACVVLHELGHSLVALHYKIPVASITLLPIGGISRITKKPPPNQELWITLAGPAVNVVIAALLWGFVPGHSVPFALREFWQGQGGTLTLRSFLTLLFAANVMLFVFNLIPAFPMDGGRILRAFLAVAGMEPARATRLAARVGQILAIVAFVLVLMPHTGIFSHNLILALIAVFVFFGAGQESAATQQQATLSGIPVSHVMLTHVETLAPGDTLKQAADRLLATSQQDFPVVNGDHVIGLMTRTDLLQGLAREGPEAYVAVSMRREFPSAPPDADMAKIFSDAVESNNGLAQSLPLVVMDGDRMLGMVTGENIAEYFAIQRMLAQGQHRWHG